MKIKKNYKIRSAGFTPLKSVKSIRQYFSVRFPNFKEDSLTGFTMVEIVVAIFILGLALASMYGILSVDMATATASKNNYIASMLAQEGVELVRNFRDSDWIAGRPFGFFIANTSITDYAVQWNQAALLPAAFADEYLKKDASGIFSYDNGDDTIFKRAVTIDESGTKNPNAEIEVTVTVTWNERGVDKKLSAEDHLFNWH